MDREPQRASSSGTKKVLVFFAVLAGASLLACLVCGVSGWLWLESKAGEMREMGVRIEGEAAEFAAAHTQEECRDEALRRSDACGPATEIMCHAEVGVFFRRCLGAATPSPALCEGVPPIDDIMGGAQWAAGYCAQLGRPQQQGCPQLVRAIVEHCAQSAR